MTTIAVNYDNGQIFQHFGKTEFFKVFKVENGEILSSEVIEAYGEGHESLAGQLKDIGADMVICGGLGAGMLNALKSNGIVVCSGVSGDVDEAVKSFLAGTLEYDQDCNCDHHEHHHEEGAASHGCAGGGCGGGCCGGEHREPVGNEGKVCRVHYKGTFNDGTQFDSSYDRGEPLEFVCGAGMMIKGFDEAVVMMNVGEVKDIHLMPEDAYGMPNPQYIFSVDIEELPGSEDLEVGQQVYLENEMGQPFPVIITEKDDKTITFDANHEMAGKELNFRIELVEVK